MLRSLIAIVRFFDLFRPGCIFLPHDGVKIHVVQDPVHVKVDQAVYLIPLTEGLILVQLIQDAIGVVRPDFDQ